MDVNYFWFLICILPSQEAPSLQIDIVPNPADMSDQEAFDSFVSSPQPSGYKKISKSTLT